jgi:hypothetical protein
VRSEHFSNFLLPADGFQEATNSNNRLRMEKVPELKLFAHIALALGDHGKLIASLDADSAGKVGRGDEDMAVVQLDAMLSARQRSVVGSENDTATHPDVAANGDGQTVATGKWSTLEACEWLQDIIDGAGARSDGALQLDDWQIWKELVKLHKEYLQDSTPEDAAQ